MVSTASLPCPAWGQSAWPSYPNNSAISVTSGGNVGIGTTSASTKLEVWGPDTTTGHFMTRHSTGVYAAQFFPYLGTSLLSLRDAGAWDEKVRISSTGPTWFTGGNLGIGTTNPQYLLSVSGTIGAKDVIVTNSGWSDYVFRPGYRLRPLSEVKSYIQANHHLPDIPTEAEVKEKGVSVGDMQAKLLAKIEELTLHMIHQDKENKELRTRIGQLETRAESSGAAAGR